MLDTLVTVLLVTLFVLGLFGLVHWLLSCFPPLRSARWNPSVGKWWIILLLIVIWLECVRDLFHSGRWSQWTVKQYFDILVLCAVSYCIVLVWKWAAKPIKKPASSDPAMKGGQG